MEPGKPAALALIVLITLVVIFVVGAGIDRWRHRVNPQIVNQPPATAAVAPHAT